MYTIFAKLSLHQTRLLVTNGINFLSRMDMIVVLNNGTISEMGTYSELLTHNGAFSEFIATYLKETEDDSSGVDEEGETY